MNISIKGALGVSLAIVTVLVLSSSIALAKEIDNHDDYSEFDTILDDMDFNELDDYTFGLNDDDLQDVDLENIEYVESVYMLDKDGLPLTYDDFVDEGDLDDVAGWGDLFDTHEDFNASKWSNVKMLVDTQDESDVEWTEILPDIDTGEVEIFGKESGLLFGIFEIDVIVSGKLNADGELQEIKRPWYSFLLW